jgi:hypothetical protein
MPCGANWLVAEAATAPGRAGPPSAKKAQRRNRRSHAQARAKHRRAAALSNGGGSGGGWSSYSVVYALVNCRPMNAPQSEHPRPGTPPVKWHYTPHHPQLQLTHRTQSSTTPHTAKQVSMDTRV